MLKFDSYSERGVDHSDNEDYVLCEAHSSGGDRHLCFVADGQGGRADGAAAARIACESALKVSRQLCWQDLASSSTWDSIFSAADGSVQGACDGCTTLIGLAIDPVSLSGASIGDSKAFYHERSGEFFELSERQQKNPPIGGGCHRATTFHVPGYNGTLVAASDGVWKYSGYEALKEVTCTGDFGLIPHRLREAVVSRQGANLPDDFTVFAVTNLR